MTRLNQRGFTLIELIIFILVMGIGLAGILSVMNAVVKSSADPMVRKQTMALADSIMEEILQKEYDDPDGLQGGETTRATMDDVFDYHGKSNALFTDLPSALATYLIGIKVEDDPTTLGIAAKKVTVTITRGTEAITMTGYRTKY